MCPKASRVLTQRRCKPGGFSPNEEDLLAGMPRLILEVREEAVPHGWCKFRGGGGHLGSGN